MNWFWIRLSLIFAGMTFSGALLAAEETPEWEFEIEESELVGFESVSWFAKDYGWLMTFRLTAPSPYVIRPITHLRLEGANAEEAVVWEDSKVIRRRDMDASLGGSYKVFVRIMLDDVPEDVATMRMRFDNGDDETAAVAED